MRDRERAVLGGCPWPIIEALAPRMMKAPAVSTGAPPCGVLFIGATGVPVRRASASADRHGHTGGDDDQYYRDDAHRHQDADQADRPVLLLDGVPDSPPPFLAQLHSPHLPCMEAELSVPVSKELCSGPLRYAPELADGVTRRTR